jgi:hypothetical protein
VEAGMRIESGGCPLIDKENRNTVDAATASSVTVRWD